MTAPQIVRAPDSGLGQAAASFIEAMMRRQQLDLQREELKLRKQAFEQEQTEAQTQQAQQGQVGEALRSLIMSMGTAPVQAPTISPTGGLGPAVPALGMTPLAAAVQPMRAAAVPQFVEQSRDLRAEQSRLQGEAARISAFESAIKTVAPERQPLVRAMYDFERSGLNLTESERRTIWPQLAPILDTMAPQQAAQIFSWMRVTGGTFGQGLRLFGLPSIEGIPDDTRAISGIRQPQPREQEVVTSGHQSIMENELPIILTTVGQGLSLPTTLLAQLRTNLPLVEIINKYVPESERPFFFSMMRYLSSKLYGFSGKQINNEEFTRFLLSQVPFVTDDEETRRQKIASFYGDIDAIRAMAGGASSASTALERRLTIARTEGWRPELIAAYERQLADAKKWEERQRQRFGVPIFADDQPSTPQTFEQNYQMWRDNIMSPQRPQ